MGSFDLNSPVDFARATNSFGSSILQPFTGRGPSAWLIEEGAYESQDGTSVTFHVFRTATSYNGAVDRISDSGGRRKAKFVFPGIDGQLTEDQGREAETFDINILLFGGTYLDAFGRLMNLLNDPTPGTLTHPVRGRIRCAMERYEIVHEERSRKAISIRLTMIEHSLDAISFAKAQNQNNTSAPSKIAKLAAAFQKIENAIEKVQANINVAQSFKNNFVQRLGIFKAAWGKVAGNMNATFNPGGNIPALLPTQQGGLQDANGNVVAASTSIVTSLQDPLAAVPLTLVNTALQTALAIEQLAKDVITTRETIAGIIATMEEADSLDFFDNIIDHRGMANDIQDAYEAGKQSSQVSIIKYVTPRIMSVREAAFLNGLNPDDGIQIAYLNPGLGSLNLIPKGTELKVAVS